MGMSIILSLPLSRFMPSENMLMNDGVMIKLTEPEKGYEFDAIFVPTGVHALLQLRATQLDFMNDPPRYTCRQEDPSGHYAPLLCYQRCLLYGAHNSCECRYVGLPRDNNSDDPQEYLPACKPRQLIKCIYPYLGNTYRTDPNFALRCKERCESRCNYWQYHATVSYAKYPSHTLVQSYFPEDKRNNRRTTIDEIQAREIVLELFYDKLEYTLIKHFPSMTLDQFIANIGGQMGLWMGGSILSLIHLIVFVIMLSKDKTKHTANALKYNVSAKQLHEQAEGYVGAFDISGNPEPFGQKHGRRSSLVVNNNGLHFTKKQSANEENPYYHFNSVEFNNP